MYERYCEKKERNIKAHLKNPKLSKQMQNELANFIIEYATARKLSIPTQESYTRSLSFFGEFLHNKQYSSYKQATVEDIKAYFGDPYPRNHRKKSDSILIWVRSSLKVFYRWLLLGKVNRPRREDKYPELVDWIEVGMMKGKRITDKDILTPEEFKMMLDASKNQRDRAFLSMLYETGCRLGELLDVKLEDIHFEPDRAYIDITRSKTEPRRIFIFDSCMDLKNWLIAHPKKDDPQAYLFTNVLDNKKENWNYDSALSMVKRTARRAGIKKKVWIHLFRHTSATRDSRRGMPDDLMRLKYGWGKNSQMLNRYRHRNYEDIMKWEEEKRGVGVEKPKDPHEPKKCYRCGELNAWNNSLCGKCGMNLDREMFEKSLVFEKLASETTKQKIEEQDRKIEEQDKKIEELMKKIDSISK